LAALETGHEDIDKLRPPSLWHRARAVFPQLPCFREERAKLGAIIESFRVQLALVVLLVLDVLVVGGEMALEEFAAPTTTCELTSSGSSVVAVVHKHEEWTLQLKEALHVTGLIFLSVFALELLLLVVAYDVHFFLHPMFTLDLVVVTASVTLDLTLRTDLPSLIVVFRLWRVIRISHAIVMAVEAQHKKHHEQLKERLKHVCNYTHHLKEILNKHGIDITTEMES